MTPIDGLIAANPLARWALKVLQLARCAQGKHWRNARKISHRDGHFRSTCLGCGTLMVRQMDDWTRSQTPESSALDWVRWGERPVVAGCGLSTGQAAARAAICIVSVAPVARLERGAPPVPYYGGFSVRRSVAYRSRRGVNAYRRAHAIGMNVARY